jgi:hypothetical protein
MRYYYFAIELHNGAVVLALVISRVSCYHINIVISGVVKDITSGITDHSVQQEMNRVM